MRDHLRNALLGLVLLLVPGLVSAQVGTVQGRVTERGTGVPVPGVNVTLEGYTFGTATDVDGNYSFSAPVGSYTLLASAIGYQRARQPITIASGETVSVNFVLREDLLGLDEVVVTGAGSATSRRRLGIDVGSVSGDQLSQAATPSLDAALAGKIAGAQITQSGQPGAPSQIILRGINTIGSTTPLILLDGIQINTDVLANGSNQGSSRLSDIDFTNIERVEVVKGAAASALYGAQGANGVIQLFTRRGQAGRPRVTFNSSTGFSEFTRGNVEYADLHSFSTDADGNITGLTQDPNTRIWSNVSQNSAAGSVIDKPYKADGQMLPLYDNVLAVFRTAVNTNNNITVSGGSDAFTYLASGSATRQQGVEEAVDYWRNAFQLNLGSRLRDDFRLDARVNLINSQNRGETVSGNNVMSQIGSSLSLPRYIDITERDPETGMYLAQQQAGQTANSPLFYKEINDRKAELVRIINNISANYQPVRFVELDYKLGLDHYRNQFEEVQQNVNDIPNNAPVLTKQGLINNTATKATTVTSNATAFLRTDFQRDFGMSFPVQTTTQLAYDYRRELYQSLYAGGTGLPTIPLQTLRFLDEPDIDESRSTFVTYGFLANQKFDFGDYGGFSVGGRVDQSSAFREGEGTEFFPRADAYVRLTSFLPEDTRSRIAEFKLRAAYGSAGTQPGAYDRLLTLSASQIGSSGTLNTPSTLQNPQLLVERSNEAEFGADLAFAFGSRFFSSVGINVTYWDRSSEDVIYSLPVSPSTGSSFRFTNGYTIASNGVDLSVAGLVANTRNFSWNTTLNFGKQKSIVDKIATGEDVVVTANGMPFVLSEGESVGAHFGNRAVRSIDEINPRTDQPFIAEADRYKYGIVDGRVVNVATQRVLFRPFQEVIGDATPDFTLSFRNDFTILRDLSLGIQLDWVKGADIYNATRQRMYQYNLHTDNDDPIDLKGAVPGPDGNILLPIVTSSADAGAIGQPSSTPRAWAAYANSLYNTSVKNDYFIEDGSFVKLRELSLSYNLTPLLQRLSTGLVNRVTLNFSGRNLLTFTKYKGFDPEVNEGGTSSLVRGYDYYTYPNFRTYTFGATITL